MRIRPQTGLVRGLLDRRQPFDQGIPGDGDTRQHVFAEVGTTLAISPHTVTAHVRKTNRKLAVLAGLTFHARAAEGGMDTAVVESRGARYLVQPWGEVLGWKW